MPPHRQVSSNNFRCTFHSLIQSMSGLSVHNKFLPRFRVCAALICSLVHPIWLFFDPFLSYQQYLLVNHFFFLLLAPFCLRHCIHFSIALFVQIYFACYYGDCATRRNIPYMQRGTSALEQFQLANSVTQAGE